MAKKPKAPEQENTPVVPGAVLPESQQPEQTEAPPFEPDTQPPEVTAEEAAILEEEGKTTLFEMSERFPDPGEVVIPADLTEQLLADKNGAKIAAAKDAEAAAAVIDFPQQEQPEDTRQEWEKPLAEIEAEQQPKRKGRPPKDKDTSGQVGSVDKVPLKSYSLEKRQEKRRPLASSYTCYHPFQVQHGRRQETVILHCL